MVLQFDIKCFKELIETYPTWNTLKTFLESEDGGTFCVTDTNKDGLCLIRYEKGSSNMNLSHSKWFRSVVWNTQLHRPVSISPPKAASDPLPTQTDGLVCQELLDGFMINCFRMAGDNRLYITSRSKMDAAGQFYSSKTFRQLFVESYLHLATESDQMADDLLQVHGTDMMGPLEKDVAVCYSFLVQHKEHRIVTPITENRSYLLHTCTIHSDGGVTMTDAIPSFRNQAQVPYIPSATLSETWIQSLCNENTWKFQGVVVKDGVGNRWRFRSEKYMTVKSLRGNHPSLLNQFADLYTQNLTYMYLEYYPEDSIHFFLNTMFMNQIIKMVHDLYIQLHVLKTIVVADIDKMYLPHLYNLHGIYLSQLRSEGKKITVSEIIKYFHKQPWQRIAFLLKKNQDVYFAQLGNVINADPMNEFLA